VSLIVMWRAHGQTKPCAKNAGSFLKQELKLGSWRSKT
jgi:hypothetical protein